MSNDNQYYVYSFNQNTSNDQNTSFNQNTSNDQNYGRFNRVLVYMADSVPITRNKEETENHNKALLHHYYNNILGYDQNDIKALKEKAKKFFSDSFGLNFDSKDQITESGNVVATLSDSVFDPAYNYHLYSQSNANNEFSTDQGT
jgi:hypothetical protein